MKTNEHKDIKEELENLGLISKLVKRNMLRTIFQAQTGHVGGCCSSNELMSVLYFSDFLQLNSDDPKDPNRDYIVARGHLGPLRYNLFALLGWLKQEEMSEYRKFGSRLPGHENMEITPGVDITPSGNLGMVLSYAVGSRLSFRKRGLENRVFCFIGDGEEQEGSIGEAARHAANLSLDGLIVIIDQNKKQLSTSTNKTDKKTDISQVWRGYGYQVIKLEKGNSVPDIYFAYKQALELSKKGPVCIIASTTKGNGIKGAKSSYNGYHVYHNNPEDTKRNNVPIEEEIDQLTKQIEGKNIQIPKKKITRKNKPQIRVSTEIPDKICISPQNNGKLETSYDYLFEYLQGLSEFGKSKNIYVLTADYPPRTLVYDEGKFAIPNLHYINVGIREQHVLAMLHGIKTTEPSSEVIVLCGDAFVYRFVDQMNVLAQAKDKAIIYSVEPGLAAAKNGFTHQSSGQPGVILTMPGIDLYEPSSKLDWFYVMNKALNEPGPKFIRTHKLMTPFDFGGFKEADCYAANFQNEPADCTLVSNGMLFKEVLDASKSFYDKTGKKARVVNVVNVKNPSGIEHLVENNRPLAIVYNGNPSILGFPVYRQLAISGIHPSRVVERGFEKGKTGSIKELLHYFSVDSEGIYSLLETL